MMGHMKVTMAAVWIISAGAFGILAPHTTPASWFALVALATTPPLIFMHYGRPAPQKAVTP